ncbi:increased rDNA silencing protein 4 [Colletotrichum orchidophilum]|uniref:Increased rDNA silencing protein 4 n=1 Tax=Colletotrichum orchidophilum TaxID=1209926 RepID=A0A1G4BQK1_9PEZI|nr:increased rDNA silencing protein 4 [Colletotrichum orchidophilum]OHF03731.1 increased rDNA silencing protein 4 [Colletotrichum orchidophilum]
MMMNTHHNHHHHPPPSGGASDAAAALKGANLAFNKTKPKPIPPPKPINTGGGGSGISRRRGASLIAASTASTYDRSTSTSPIQRQHTGASLATTPGDGGRFGRDGTSDMRDRLSNFLASSPAASSTTSHLTPHTSTRLDPKSPSYIAATLAASRSASPSPHASPAASALTPAQMNQLQQMQLARRSRRGSVGETESVVSSLDLPDTTSIPATGHLINMFERGGGEDVDPVKRSGGGGGDVSARPKIRPLTPERELSPARAKAARMGIVEEPVVLKTKPTVKPRPVTPIMAVAKGESMGDVTPQARQPALKSSPAKPILSPAKAVHREIVLEPPPLARGRESAVSMPPKASEAPVVRSRSQLTRVPITRTLMPESKAARPPATPEPRRSRIKATPSASVSPPLIERAGDEIRSPEPKRPESKAKLQPPTPPQPRGRPQSKERVPRPLTKPRSMASVYGHSQLQEPFRRSKSGARPSTADTSSSNDTFVSAESNQTAVPEYVPSRPTARQTNSTHSTPSRSSANSSPSRATPRRTPASSTTSLPLNSLSNAIMAGSLAAARLTPSNSGQSTLSPPQLPPSRTKSPRLRQTLRQPPSKSDDEDEIRRKKHQHGSNKHSHKEGARRRWRDEITVRERRRYEAVWASNRGMLLVDGASSQGLLLLPPPSLGGSPSLPHDAADCVVDIVAREVWRRSRLPREELAEVWDAVDRRHRGMLSKVEFVVGLWLIDQRLRGRKIPARVSASVWDSAQGVKVRSPKMKK